MSGFVDGRCFCFYIQNDLQSIFVKLKSSLRCCLSVVRSSALHSNSPVARKRNTISAREQFDFVTVFMVSGGKCMIERQAIVISILALSRREKIMARPSVCDFRCRPFEERLYQDLSEQFGYQTMLDA
jgi:hypothetical protein